MSTEPIGVITSMPASSVRVPANKPLDDFFRALMRHHDSCMKQKAAEASRQTGPEGAQQP